MKKKIIALLLVVAMVSVAVIGGTLAYFTDNDTADNIFVVGNIDIEINEEVPSLEDLLPGIETTKKVLIENKGSSEAYVRVLVTVPKYFNAIWSTNVGEGKAWTIKTTATDSTGATVYTLWYNTTLAARASTQTCLEAIYIDKWVDKELNNAGDQTVTVFAEAIQAKGFATIADAFAALDTQKLLNSGDAEITTTADEITAALAAGKSVVMSEDIADAPVVTTAPYGNAYGVKQDGGVFDGNDNTLDFNKGLPNAQGKYDNYGIMTSGGTIKNVTITGVFRGIMIMYPTQDIYIDNVVIGGEDVCYPINTAEGDGTHDVYISNSTLKGWSSFGTAIKSLSFTNCTFAQGEYYTDVYGRLVKPYVNTVFKNCEFNSKFYIDLSALVDGATVTLENCTVNGVLLTADNWTSLIAAELDCGEGQISIEARDGSYMTAGNALDYVIIK